MAAGCCLRALRRRVAAGEGERPFLGVRRVDTMLAVRIRTAVPRLGLLPAALQQLTWGAGVSFFWRKLIARGKGELSSSLLAKVTHLCDQRRRAFAAQTAAGRVKLAGRRQGARRAGLRRPLRPNAFA